MKKIFIAIILFAGLNQLNAQQSLQNKVDSLKFPRLFKFNTYSPANFPSDYLSEFGIDIGLDSGDSALIGDLRIYDMVITSELGPKFQYLKNTLNPNLILFHNWNTVGAFLPEIGYPPPSCFPYIPKWFSSLVGSELDSAASIGDTIIKVKLADKSKFLFSFTDTINNREWNWNDNIFIEDSINPADSSEMILIDSTLSNYLHIRKNANYYYDFSKIKHNHLPGSKVWIIHCPVWSDWWGYNISSVCPKEKIGGDSLKYNEYMARKIAQSFKDFNLQQNLVDGIWLDTYNDYYLGPYCDFLRVHPYIDMDLNGIADSQDTSLHFNGNDTLYTNWINSKWTEGRTELVKHLRDSVGPNVPIVLNDGGINSIQYVNGVHYEKLPVLVWDTTMGSYPSQHEQWLAALQQYTAQMDTTSSHPSPRICQIQGTQSNGSFTLYDFKKMRKTLTFTLMNNGYYQYSDWYKQARTFWWFDEYTVDSTGSAVTHIDGSSVNRVDSIYQDTALYEKLKKAKGYLGFPLGNYQNLGGNDTTNALYGVLRRDFDNGVVFCNLRGNNVTITLNSSDSLKHIQGKQDSITNNGQTVNGFFVLPGNDGLILLRSNNIVTGHIDNYSHEMVIFYPNPFTETTTLEITNWKNENYDLKIYDLFGREVGKYKIKNTKTEISRDNLPCGMYFYQVIDKQQVVGNGKIIIQ